MISISRGTRRRRFDVLTFTMLTAAVAAPVCSLAAVRSSTLHGLNGDTFDSLISSADLIQGQNTLDVDVFENPGDLGWHTVNTNPADQLSAFTDGAGFLSDLTGLLNDLDPPTTGVGIPVKVVEYPFATPVDIGRLNIFTGNRKDPDGRIFSTVYIEYSTDNAFNFEPLGYFQSDPSGRINRAIDPVPPLVPAHHTTIMSIFDDTDLTMLSGVTNIIFTFYSVDNTQGQNRDPFDGVNPYTGIDDGFSGAFVSPLVFEIDVHAPSTFLIGDYNGDGFVDAADYTSWRDTLGNNVTPGMGADGSENGVVDIDDYYLWHLYFDSSDTAGPGAASAAAVPEPDTLGMAFAVFGLVYGNRRIRRRSAERSQFGD